MRRINDVTAPAVKCNGPPGPDKAGLKRLPKAKLIAMILEQLEDTRKENRLRQPGEIRPHV